MRRGLGEPVLIVGTGLIGTSLALSLRRAGVPVWLSDRDPAALATAVSLGAGQPLPGVAGALHGESSGPGEASAGTSAVGQPDVTQASTGGGERRLESSPGAGEPRLVVVAVPPAAAPAVIADALRSYPRAVVTDVASVKEPIYRALQSSAADLSRYVGGHPMAGSEVSGPAAARADLIDDRPWVITPHPGAAEVALRTVRDLALAARALPVVMPPEEHDHAVAVVSHTPQLLSSLLAARLLDASDAAVSIAGQGLRDMTRIAASNRDLWVEILSANAAPVAAVLEQLSDDLQSVRGALSAIETGGGRVVAQTLDRGNLGRERVPGKHGARPAPTAEVPVAVQDRAGELGRLFAAVAEAGFSVEDVRIEHALGRPTGVVEITVGEAAAEPLAESLRDRGWDVRA